MGFYINPTDMTKEQWIERYAVSYHLHPPREHKRGENVAICLVDNGAFTAAAILYSSHELNAFARADGRDKVWFFVPISAVADFMHGQEIHDD